MTPLPEGAAVSPLEARATLIDLTPGARQPWTIELTAAAGEGGFATTRRLANGASIAYRVETNEGGSGGAETQLEGRLSFDGFNLGVVCRAQRELPPPRPDWCLEILARARIETAR